VRIAIVGTELCAVDRRGGGLEQVLRRWAQGLALRHEVIVVSHQPGARSVAADDEPYEVRTVDRPADLAGAVAALAPDVVSLHNRPSWVTWCSPGTATAVTFHNYPPAWKVPARFLARTRAAVRGAEMGAVSAALGAAAAAHLGVTAGRVWLTPPSIDPAYVSPPPWRPEDVVLSPNRLLRKKGVLELLEVAARHEFANVTFAFADLVSPWLRPTAEHRELRDAVRSTANAVLFAPASTPAELAERYARSAVVVCPVREEEGLGLVALEAQACGVPLVTTDLGGLSEATFPPNAAVPAGDPDALAGAISSALRRQAAPVPGPRRAVLRHHTPAASAAVFEAWLQAAVERRAGRPPATGDSPAGR